MPKFKWKVLRYYDTIVIMVFFNFDNMIFLILKKQIVTFWFISVTNVGN